MKNSAVDVIDKFVMALLGVLVVTIGIISFTYYDLKKVEKEIAIIKSKRDKELDRVLQRAIKDMEENRTYE